MLLEKKRFSIKVLKEELERQINMLSNWRPDYHHVAFPKHNNYEIESRARNQGEVEALASLKNVLTKEKKQEVLDLIKAEINLLQSQHGFTNQTGWAQVDGRGETKNKAYGQYSRLLFLFSNL
jgi:hypothetical protein